MYIIIDTETTGLPKTKGWGNYYDPKEHCHYDPARLVQVAWKVLNEKFETMWSENYIVKRDGFSIDNQSFHGITNSISDRRGVPLDDIFGHLYAALMECDVIVAHNLAFDEHIILNHTYRTEDTLLRDRWNSMTRVCTMKISRDLLKLPNQWGGYKYPKLEELYHYFFNQDFTGAHNAQYDVDACAECFIRLST